MKQVITIACSLISIISFGQSSDSTKVDSASGYEVKVPTWLRLMETGSPAAFGGTLPAVKGIENAISVKGFTKSQFRSFDEFKTIFLTGNVFGQPTKFDPEQVWYGQNELIEISNGVKQKVFIFWQGKIYHNQFILLQSATSYILIQFVATAETYDVNISKFEEFMAGFRLVGS